MHAFRHEPKAGQNTVVGLLISCFVFFNLLRSDSEVSFEQLADSLSCWSAFSGQSQHTMYVK